ncbi:hypothetical protein T03_3549 [Trichinella britovi]|uniref:Uncharacterized protein n=1 Tax=Trichinella britovi TaxID=45882 RepID=A0A0V1CWB1_TRIBR|nr:hypothetical protein T03_3549 [Trichinella britovi]
MPLADRRSNSSILTFKVERRISTLFFIGETLILDTSAIPTSPARKTRMLATKPLSLKARQIAGNDFTKRSVADADRANNSIPPDNEAEEKSEVDSTDVRVRSFRRNVGEACGNTSLSVLARERKGNPPINTGQSPNSDDRANNKVEEVNELARGSGSLQKMKA